MPSTITITLPVCRSLEQSKTHGDRRYHWLKDEATATGTLTICQGKREVETYLVEEDTSEPFPGRMWLLAKQTGDAEVYRVENGPEGWRCCCKGFTRHHHCKHADAMKDLFQLGDLDPKDNVG